jgi:nitrate reductase delta subunit
MTMTSMTFFRIASALLDYPDATLRAALPEIIEAIAGADSLSATERTALAGLAGRLSAADPMAVEESYVNTFDTVPEHSLHLTHHLFGEDKNRGPALIDLSEYYSEHGFNIREKELPDYLPLLLEFASALGTEEGLPFLSSWNKVLRQLHANLAAARSSYAELIGLVEARCRLAEADDAIAEPAEKTDPCLDAGDFEPPVNWSAPAACAPSRVPNATPIHLPERAAASLASRSSTRATEPFACR